MAETSTTQTLTEVRGDLVLAALCVGQFRAPCQIEGDRLLVQADDALAQALHALGLELRITAEPFTPAPLFAPEQTLLDQVARGTTARRASVHVHASHDHDVEAPEEPSGRGSNA